METLKQSNTNASTHKKTSNQCKQSFKVTAKEKWKENSALAVF